MAKLRNGSVEAITTDSWCDSWCLLCVETVGADTSQEKTAIITTLGLYKFLRMPYGFKNPVQCFQRNVHQLLSDLPFAHFVYMDDVIVGSGNKEDHI